MSNIVFYILIIAFAVLSSVLEAKKKQKQTTAMSQPDEEEEFAEPMTTAPQEKVVAEPLFEEGSDRILHSSQIASAQTQKQKHSAHPIYGTDNVNAAESDTSQMSAEDMRQALIYKTILDRIEY